MDKKNFTLGALLLVAAFAILFLSPRPAPTPPAPPPAAAPAAPGPPPTPRATSPADLAASLRAQSGPPSPELLRDSPQAQAAYDASAQPGDYVTPPSVSVEH